MNFNSDDVLSHVAAGEVRHERARANHLQNVDTVSRSPVSRQELSRDHHTLQQSVHTWHVPRKHGPEEGHKGIESHDIQMKIILWWVEIQSSRQTTLILIFFVL